MKVCSLPLVQIAAILFLPFNYPAQLVYTAFDNDTTVGWFNQLSDCEKISCLSYLGCTSLKGVSLDLIQLALSS